MVLAFLVLHQKCWPVFTLAEPGPKASCANFAVFLFQGNFVRNVTKLERKASKPNNEKQ